MSDVDCMTCLVVMAQDMPSDGAFKDPDDGITHATLTMRREDIVDDRCVYVDKQGLCCSLAKAGFGGIPFDEVRWVPRRVVNGTTRVPR